MKVWKYNLGSRVTVRILEEYNVSLIVVLLSEGCIRRLRLPTWAGPRAFSRHSQTSQDTDNSGRPSTASGSTLAGVLLFPRSKVDLALQGSVNVWRVVFDVYGLVGVCEDVLVEGG